MDPSPLPVKSGGDKDDDAAPESDGEEGNERKMGSADDEEAMPFSLPPKAHCLAVTRHGGVKPRELQFRQIVKVMSLVAIVSIRRQ